jgi:hypothetical protein
MPKIPFTPIPPIDVNMAITQLRGNVRDLSLRLETLEKALQRLALQQKL